MPECNPKSDDFYAVLGVAKGASDAEIAKAYKKAALKHHPDKNPDDRSGAEERFKAITEAYEVLHDADKRSNYDRFGKAGMDRGGGGGGGGANMNFQHADEIFKAFFGGSDPFSVMFGGGDDNGFGFPMGGGGMGGPMGGMFGGGSGGQRVSFSGPQGMNGGGFRSMGGKGGSGANRAPTPAYAMSAGTTVVIRGLEKAPEHNGRSGRVTGFDAVKERYQVDIDNGDTTLALRPQSLTQQCRVTLVGVESKPELNGKSGEILGYNAEQSRYSVKLSTRLPNGRDVVGLQCANVILNEGTCVTTQGLSKEELNGMMGKITEVHREEGEAGKYTVRLKDGKAIKCKFDKVLC